MKRPIKISFLFFLGISVFIISLFSLTQPDIASSKQYQQYMKKLTGSVCKIQGTVMRVPNYLEVKVWVYGGRYDDRFIVTPGTRQRFFTFPVKCNTKTVHRNYMLHYEIRRHYGEERAPEWSRWIDVYKNPGEWGVPCDNVTHDHPVYLDYPRYFNQLTTTGILLREMKTDKPRYTFGEVINLTIKVVIKAPGRRKRVSETADYTVTVTASGISHEVERDEMTVWLGKEEVISIPIHHTKYSMGSNKIELVIRGSDYSYTHNIYRIIG